MGTRVLPLYQKAIDCNTGVENIPRSVDVGASCQEKASFTSCYRKAGLRHADVARLPNLVVLFYFLVEGGFLSFCRKVVGVTSHREKANCLIFTSCCPREVAKGRYWCYW